jgi:aldose 1-epimerase
VGAEDYQLPVAAGGHHLHGGEQGFGQQWWQLLEASENSARFAYHSRAGEQGYPGALAIEVRYTLTDDNELRVAYSASADRRTVLSPTQHSYFNLAGHGSGSIVDHQLLVNAEAFVPLAEDFIPVGPAVPVQATAMDFRERARLAERLNVNDRQLAIAGGFDHSWILDPERDWQRDAAAVLFEPATGRRMAVYTDRPALHFYSGNMLHAGTVGKQGSVYGPHSGLCLETQHIPAPVFDGDDPAVRLMPGQQWTSETRFAFSGF